MKAHKILFAIAAGLSMAGFLSACDDEKQLTLNAPEGELMREITFDCSSTLPLGVGMDTTLTYTVGPDSITDLSVIFKSSDESIATVDQNGTIHAVAVGKAIISAVPSFGFKVYDAEASVIVDVLAEIVKASAINIENTTPSADGRYFVTDELNLKAEILPADHTYSRIYWSSSDESIVTVNQEGLAICQKEGEAFVYANSTDQSGVRGEYKVVVSKYVAATGVSIQPLAGAVCLTDGAFPLEVNYTPAGATVGSVEWSSNNEAVATVHRGIVTPTGFGTAIITAKCIESGATSTVTIAVEDGLYRWNANNQWDGWNVSKDNGTSEKGDKTWRVQMMPDPIKWRRDIRYSCTSAKPMTVNLKAYPVFAVRLTTLNGCNTKLDAVDLTPLDAGEPNPKSGIDLGDGTSLLIYNLAACENFKTLATTDFQLFQIKIADIAPENYTEENAYYEIYWMGTFSSEDEAKQYAADQIAAGK